MSTEHGRVRAATSPEVQAELDQEWDAERVLAANPSSLTLLQHALQGWCPRLALIRRLGVRIRREIDAERTALKVLRGDFGAVSVDPADPVGLGRRALEGAGRR